jgi:hypothetical protein
LSDAVGRRAECLFLIGSWSMHAGGAQLVLRGEAGIEDSA